MTGPTPHSRSTGSGMEERQLAVGRHHEQPVGLGHAAGHLGEELGPGHPDRDGQADVLADVAPQPRGDLRGRAGDPPQPADVEERLVDRQPFDQRRRVARTPRTPPCSPRSRPTSAAGPRPPAGRAGGPARRPSPCGRRTPWPRSWRRARRPPRRSPGGRAGEGRPAARPRRRRRRGRRAGWSPPLDTNTCSHRAETERRH